MHTHRSLRLYRCECVLTSVRLFWHCYNNNNISVFSRVVAGFTIHGVCWTLLDIGQCLIDQRTLTIVGSRVPVWDLGPGFFGPFACLLLLFSPPSPSHLSYGLLVDWASYVHNQSSFFFLSLFFFGGGGMGGGGGREKDSRLFASARFFSPTLFYPIVQDKDFGDTRGCNYESRMPLSKEWSL